MVRRIQYDSNANVAYDTAAEWQVDTGLGYFRIYTDYCEPDSFEQDVKIARIVDPSKVKFDPESTEPDGSDANWAFIDEEINRDEFEDKYPDVDVSGWNVDGAGTSAGWYSKDTVRIAEYFYIEKEAKTLCLLQDGTTIYKDELPEQFHELIKAERKSEIKTCKWCKIAGDQELDSTELATSYVPLIPVLGSEVWIEGKRHLHGLTRHAKDPARLYNYMQSANTELLALAPKAPFIGAVGQFEGLEQSWQLANSINQPYLEYNPIDVMGSVLGAPQRQQGPSTNPGLEAAMARSIDDMKSTMGIFDASLGNRESDQSGRAIQSQQRQASIGNFHFQDNLARSLQHAGRVINDLLSVYDTKRVVQVLGEDGQERPIIIDPNAPEAYQETPEGEVYNLGKGKYSIVVDVGPSYATKRQEAVDAQLNLVQSYPQLMQTVGDIVVSNMDWPGAEEMSKRLKAMLPPQIMQMLENDHGGKDQDPQVVLMMNQMADQVEQLSKALQGATDELRIKEEELEIKRFDAQTKRLEVDHKVAIESVGKFHEIASAAVAQTLLEPNDGEAEDPDEEHDQAENRAQQPAMPEMAQTTAGGALE